MLISGGGGGGFTQALLGGRQLAISEKAQKEAARARKQQLGLGIAGLGIGAVNAATGLAGTVGSLVNQSNRTGLMEQELGLRKAEEAPVEGSLFGLPPGSIHPRVASLLIQKIAAEKNPYENKIIVGDIARNRDALLGVPPGVLPEAYRKKAEATINAGGVDPRVEAAMQLQQLEATPEVGAGKFNPANLSSLDFPARAALLQKIQAAQTINAADKPGVIKEVFQRLQETGQPLYPSPGAFDVPQMTPEQFKTAGPGASYMGAIDANLKRKQQEQAALREIYLKLMQQSIPYENQFTVP